MPILDRIQNSIRRVESLNPRVFTQPMILVIMRFSIAYPDKITEALRQIDEKPHQVFIVSSPKLNHSFTYWQKKFFRLD